MRISKYIFWGFFIIITLFSCEPPQQKKAVILISFDGFRYDYPDKYDLPTFQKLIDNGVRAEAMIPSYPSKTFPNHYAIATGIYPKNNGLINNSFYNREFNETYRIGNREAVQDGKWYGGNPIWNYAEEHGVKSATYFWVGSEAPVNGKFPSYYYLYNTDKSNRERIDQLEAWLALDVDNRPGFIGFYFSEPDHTSHNYGPDSEELEKKLSELDADLNYLLETVKKTGTEANYIIISDHGMANYQENSIHYIKSYIGSTQSMIIENGTDLYLYQDDVAELKRIDSLITIRDTSHALTLFKGSDRFDNPTHKHIIPDRIIEAPEGHVVAYEQKDNARPPAPGNHGYDPEKVKSMHAIFIASGPDIKSGVTIPAFENIHVYPFLCELLNIPENSTIDGKKEVLHDLLK